MTLEIYSGCNRTIMSPGWPLTLKNNYQLAIKYAHEAYQYSPKSAPINDTLGWAYFHKGSYAKGL